MPMVNRANRPDTFSRKPFQPSLNCCRATLRIGIAYNSPSRLPPTVGRLGLAKRAAEDFDRAACCQSRQDCAADEKSGRRRAAITLNSDDESPLWAVNAGSYYGQ